MTNKHIKIIHTFDEFDCCDSYQVVHNGKTYGEIAQAHCYGEASTTLEEALLAMLADNGYTIENLEEE